MNNLLSRLSMVLLLLVSCNVSLIAQENLGIDGTYVLESRVLADGTAIKPPELIGLYNLSAGYINFNLVRKDTNGKIQSISYVGKYTFNKNEYSQEILYFSVNDEIGGSGINYDFTKKSGTSAVNIVGTIIEFPFPPNKAILATFDGDTLKARTANGAYTENWKKVD